MVNCNSNAGTHRRHCVVSLSKNINPSLVLVQPRKTRPFITERLLMERKETKKLNKQNSGPLFLPTLEGDYILKSACLSVRPFVEDMSGNFVGAIFRPFFFTIQMRMWRGNIVNFSLFLFLFFSLLNCWPLGTL